jgi:hypothetical protein
VPGTVLDYGADVLNVDDGPNWIDIVCGGPPDPEHAKSLVARFEIVPADTERTLPDGTCPWWEWRWTGSLAMSRNGDSAGGQKPPFATVRPDRQVVTSLPDGSAADAVRRLDQLRTSGVSEVPLPALLATLPK